MYKHKKKDYFVFKIELEYIAIEDHIEIADKLQYIYFTDDKGQFCKMTRLCFNNEFTSTKLM
jgi:hypothetical protein